MDDKIVVKYYCPLSVSLWDKNGEYGWDGEPETIDSSYAAEFCDEIEMALDANNDANMHEYFDGDVAKKLNSVVWGVEVVRGILYGCITVELNDFLTEEEEIDLEKALSEMRPNIEIAEAGEEKAKKARKKPAAKKKVEPKKTEEIVQETKSENEGE